MNETETRIIRPALNIAIMGIFIENPYHIIRNERAGTFWLHLGSGQSGFKQVGPEDNDDKLTFPQTIPYLVSCPFYF